MIKKRLIAFVIEHIFYIVFILLMLFKLYLFNRQTESVFFYNGLVKYFKNGFDVLFKTGSFEPFLQGIFLVSLGAMLLLTFWTLLLKGRKQFIALLILDLLVSIVAFANLIYYRYFNDLISAAVFAQANQTGAIKNSIFGLMKKNDVILFADFVIWIPLLVFFLMKKIKWNTGYCYKWKLVLAALVLATGYVFVSASINHYTAKYGNVLFKQTWYNMSVYNQTGLLGFHGLDIYKTLDEKVFNKKEVTAEQAAIVKEWFEQKQHQKAPFYGTANGKNVIVVQLEAFNNFFINKDINGQAITPHINEILGESMYYRNFYHQTAQGRTADAEFLANESLHPMSAGAAYVKYANRTYDSLAAILRENGYETAAFHAYDKTFWNRYAIYQNTGFDHFFGDKDFREAEIAGWTLGDRPFFQQSIDKMLEFDKPFYSFLVALSSHHPYDIQDQFKTLDLTGYEGIFANYIHSVHYVDQAVGEMVERLKAEGLWDDSIFILYGDHDYGVKEEESMAKVAGSLSDPLTVEQLYNQIPLIIHLPNDEGQGVYANTAGQIDIAPTILHLLGLVPDELYMMGSNVTDGENNLVAFRYGSYTDGTVYFKASQDGVFENGTCYDLQTRAVTEVKACLEGYKEAQKRLRVSDNVLLGNLIRKMKDDN